jgi:glycerol-3-phosphate dehydrogenase
MNDLASGVLRFDKADPWRPSLPEFYEFRLVREALMEREVLWRNAPHIIWPMRFVLPHAKGLRPAWLIRLGLFLYDHIGGRKLLPSTTTLDMAKDPAGKPLKPLFRKAFEYSDGWVNDARLVALNARDAADRGATIRTRTKVVSARREGDLDGQAGRLADREGEEVIARLLVNAAGPWVTTCVRPSWFEGRAQRPAGTGQPHRHRKEIRRPTRLFLPNRRAHHLRHSLRRRVHADGTTDQTIWAIRMT